MSDDLDDKTFSEKPHKEKCIQMFKTLVKWECKEYSVSGNCNGRYTCKMNKIHHISYQEHQITAWMLLTRICIHLQFLSITFMQGFMPKKPKFNYRLFVLDFL